MRTLVLMGAIAVVAFSCSKKAEAPVPEEKPDSAAMAKETVVDTLGPKTFCYMGVTGKDTVFASIDDNLGTIIGKLRYKNAEKDSSKGDITGFKSGDTLKLTYEFAAEGTKSKSDIYFLQKGNTLTEGIGEHKTENGQMKYASDKKISYKDGQKLQAADCALVAKALK
ncbi:hypothetical protein [uncultured Chryseobacterium sp.]|uniref:hypothetical protein n=1 Tax=uncultured Chryseobacterium sp. TaxID=259322 RepID=UPI0025FCBB8A|nr:hypothetical protein [uncultured Chryseobacterium sp.]